MRNFIHLLLVIGLAGQPCGAFWFPPQCNDEVYEFDTHMCCMDELHEKPLGGVEVECCFKLVYNPLTHYCCIDGMFGGVRRAVLAPKVRDTTRGRSCFRALKRPQDTD